MKTTVYTNTNGRINVEQPDRCPRCHKYIVPEKIIAHNYVNDKNMKRACALFKCPACKNCFLTEYVMGEYIDSISIIGSYPDIYEEEKFDDGVKKISPKFCQIYNEAKRAESDGLSEICGVGYRKSLEFLVKDFAISNNPGKEELVAKCSLGDCINSYIDDGSIKMLAKKASWLGNDETHFLRKYGDIDTISKIKTFIKAIVRYIESFLAVKEAESIEETKTTNKKSNK